MAIINLEKRTTTDLQKYEENKKSAKSFIYVSNGFQRDNCSAETLVLTVGDNYLKNSQRLAIPEKGIVVKPGESKVFITMQKIATPLNIIGTIYGIGTNICKNGFISTGKIARGFYDDLKICFFNAGDHNITFKKNDVIACVIFHETEETMSAANGESTYESIPNYSMTRRQKVALFFTGHWISIASLIIALATLISNIIMRG